jgi:predicted amidophosphoribosyltransferase
MLRGVELPDRFGEVIGQAASRVLDLALPPTCAGCRREGSPLCRECRTWLRVRVSNAAGAPIGLPADIPPPLVQLEWCAPFTGVTRRALHQLKYAGERRLARPLGETVAARWQRAGAGGDALVPVPASPDRVRERGYDQAVLIARAAGRVLRLPVLPLLERTHDTAAQYVLGRSGRAANVGGAFGLRGGPAPGSGSGPGRGDRQAALPASAVAGRWLVLVDDVVTTGATLAACATALMDAGALAVSAITLARER